MPVMVAFQTLDWMPIALNSFWAHFPHFRVLVVDNNPREDEPDFFPIHAEERDWLQQHPFLIVIEQPHQPRTHGRAIDCGLQWCRDHHIDCMLHLEPDCVITGTRWYENLCQGLDRGASMSGSHRKLYGPIHPTPSLWRVQDCHTTFDSCERAADEQHPKFSEVFDLDWLLDAIRKTGGDLDFWETQWDTGQKAWFELAKDGRDHQACETDDFQHFWFGATTSIQHTLNKHPELNAYREYSYRIPENSTAALSPVAKDLGQLIISAMIPLQGQRGILRNMPQHTDPFEHLTAIGVQQALQQAGAQLCETLPHQADVSHQNFDFMFVLDHSESTAETLLADLKRISGEHRQGQKLIWLQRTWAGSEEAVHLFNELASSEVWFCDASSFGEAKRQGLQQVRLVPDPAFGVAKVPFAAMPAGERKEITRANADEWLIPGRTLKHHALEACTYVGRALQGARHITTDQVAVHIACVLAGIPNSLVCEQDSQACSVYETWTFRHSESTLRVASEIQ